MTLSKNFLIVTAKLLTGGLQYCMFKFVLKHKCDAGDGKGQLSQRLKAHRDDVIKPSLKRWLEGQDPGVFAFMKGEKSAERQFAEITALFDTAVKEEFAGAFPPLRRDMTLVAG